MVMKMMGKLVNFVSSQIMKIIVGILSLVQKDCRDRGWQIFLYWLQVIIRIVRIEVSDIRFLINGMYLFVIRNIVGIYKLKICSKFIVDF